MLKSNVGHSTLADAYAAGMQAAAAAKAGLTGVKVALAYASVAYEMDKLLAGIAQELPGVPVLGNTSFTGVITPAGYISGDAGFVGILALADEDLVVGIAGSAKNGDARETGYKVALEALANAGKDVPPDYYYMAASPGEEEFYIKGITQAVGRIPMFGGSAADNSIAGQWSLYTGSDYFGDGVITAFFYGKPITNILTGAYRESGDVGIITKVIDNRILAEIDGVPALEKYAQWAGVSPDSIKGGDLLFFTITSPLGVKDRLGDLTAIRHPMNGNDDNTMNIGANLAEGTAILRMEGSVDELIAAAASTLEALKVKMGGKAAAYHLIHCGGRRAGIGERIGEVAAAVQKVAGDVPFLMEFTFGEYGFEDDGNNTTGGLMLSYTGFPE
jgi:hypothetical protein